MCFLLTFAGPMNRGQPTEGWKIKGKRWIHGFIIQANINSCLGQNCRADFKPEKLYHSIHHSKKPSPTGVVRLYRRSFIDVQQSNAMAI
jgi:hypothetical protein